MAEVTDMLTTRGLKDGFGTPLQEFIGLLDSYSTRKDEKFNKLRVTFNFKDIKVIKSSEPYNFPIAPIDINFSEHKKSNWGVFSGSANKFMPDNEDLPWLKGKRVHMALTPGHDFGKDKEGKPMIRDCWEVVGIDGVSGKVPPEERVIEILDGKTDVQFNQIALTDPILKSAPGIMDSLVNQTLLPALETQGKITKDAAGVWHKVK
jgi:hypothetical protein